MTQAAARARAERINFHIIAALAAKRAGIGEGMGERAPVGAARAPVDLVTVKDVVRGPCGGVVSETGLTPIGYRTARRRLPLVLSRMSEDDPRRRAADMFAHASEKVGSVAGASAEGAKTDGGAATNDGGVTTRIAHAAKIAAVGEVLDAAGVVLRPKARGGSGNRRAITARELVEGVCLEGSDLKAILTRAGWSGQRRDVAALGARAELILEGMARALGLIDPAARLADDEETALGFCNAQNKKRMT